MSKPSYTPGPWEAYDDTVFDFFEVRDKKGEPIAEIPFETNARLIAAAPEMLETLHEALIAIEGECETNEDREGLIDLIKDTIAKAEGKHS